ncbi:MAG TPA: Asp-tRNA(Asn)/Glu-tRNA(Gln) amidotransferase subunit GatB [Burkholderiales bacterium]|jgi:aspartyl-tRNA(Asn)/glutamyl-tRNA(Gln) amidotransferase subunit B
MKWEIVIGLETHAQLNTRSKMFSGAATAFGAAPNTQACGVDIALPGVLPVANREAVAKAVRFGLAVNGNSPANINRRSIFARKNYFYPDLPKGYQISQYEAPIVKGGSIGIVVDGKEKSVRLTRAHLEEDAGKSLHEGFRDLTGIDLNRAGTPLLEIVTEPDMRSAQEAVAYAKALHALVRWIDICDGNMQEGSFRCDANVSVRPAGSDKLGTRCEIKNLNSFRFLERAIEFEARRQIGILGDGGKIEQETRLYDAERDETRSMRTKEEAHDYRYFPDPDLLPLVVSEEWLEEIRASMPRSLEDARKELIKQGVPPHQADQFTDDRATSTFALGSVSGTVPAQAPVISSLILGPLRAKLNEEHLGFGDSKVNPDQIRQLSERVIDGTVSITVASSVVLPAMWAGEGAPDEIIAKRGLRQISDSGELEKICDQVIAGNAQQVADYRSGKEKAFNSLVGQVMKLTKGKANPQQVTGILKSKLSG